MPTARTPSRPAPHDPHAHLDRLRAEQSALPIEIIAARRSGDAVRWLDLQGRLDDLPAEIRDAQVAVGRVDLENAWTSAEAAHTHERTCLAELDDLRAQVTVANTRLLSTIATTAQAVIARRSAIDRLRLSAEEARLAWRAARDVEGRQLVEVERLEHLLQAMTGEPPAEGTGLRARPRALAQGVTVSDDLAGAQAGEVDDFGVSAQLFPAGTVPPRWLAGRLGEHVYAAAPEFTWPQRRPLAENVRYERHVDDHARYLGGGPRSMSPAWLAKFDG